MGIIPWLALVAQVEAVETNATIKGVVLDEDGLEVPGAQVSVTAPELMGNRVETTDEEGRFRVRALPPGDYTVEVFHPSFKTWRSGALHVPLAQTVNLDIQMRLKDAQETVVVIETAPAVDIESTQSGMVLDYATLKDIPTGRDYQSAVELVPGVVGSDIVHGSFDTSNQYYLDGVNITDPLTNTFSTNLNFDAIEAVEVITGGMDAEYGRSLGGAVNVVTKSGGNEFEGSAFLLYSPPSFVAGRKLPGDSNNTDLEQQLALTFGGPIIKDKLWFFSSLQGDRLISTSSIDTAEVPRDLERFPMVPQDWRSMYAFFKLTAQPNDEHRVSMQVVADPTWIDNVEQSPYVLPQSETVQNQGGFILTAEHSWIPSDSVMLETQAYYQFSKIDYFPILWKGCTEKDARGACTTDFVGTEYMGETVTPTFLPTEQGFQSGPYPYASFNKRHRASVQSDLSLYFDALGEHEMKIGVQGEYLASRNVSPGLEVGEPYYDFVGDDINDLSAYEPSYIERYDNDQDVGFAGFLGTVYVQDAWKPIPNLTVRPGLRMDVTHLLDDRGDPVFTRANVAPRFGMVYDLEGNGKGSIRAYYGRFYDAGFLSVASLLQKKSSGYAGYNWDPRANDWSTTDDQYRVSGQMLQADKLRNPYSDEFQLGFNREIGPDLGLDVAGIYERSSRFWEDDEVNLIWNDAGTDVIGFRNGEDTTIYRLRTPDDVFTRYTALEVGLTKVFSNQWTFRGSYTWSRAYGTNDSDQATALHDIPEQYKYEVGLLSYDTPHMIKMAGSYNQSNLFAVGKVTGGFTAGWNYQLRAGFPYRKVTWNDYYQDFSNYEEDRYGRYRLPAFSQLDLRVGFNVDIGPTKWMVGVDCFNALNDRTTTDVDARYDPNLSGDDQYFGDILDRQDRRRFQFIARGEF
jgi:hypothetical protein